MPEVALVGAINCVPPFALLMLDPDAPSRQYPSLRSWLHWMVINANTTRKLHKETFDERRPLDRARMLMHCGVDICVLYMNKLHKELPGEAANLLINLFLVDSDEPGSTPFAKQVVRELHNRGVNMSFLRHIRRQLLEFLPAWLIHF
ncbi:uncharacterized protein LOC142775382 [Rhipicephalus microplus]|uniref:uncharacterized protein LOC142775382 n=1 Tax=Rhipicephalus microplus TaxID=6941 RepID=UPI003F6D9814